MTLSINNTNHHDTQHDVLNCDSHYKQHLVYWHSASAPSVVMMNTAFRLLCWVLLGCITFLIVVLGVVVMNAIFLIIMPSVIVSSVDRPSVIMPSAKMPSMQGVVMPSVVLLNVVAPPGNIPLPWDKSWQLQQIILKKNWGLFKEEEYLGPVS